MLINGQELNISPNANLCGANLSYANLCGANLSYANLCGANLSYANLCDANLCDANLSYANLCDANLRDANLCDANLRDANLCDANLRDANLYGANLRGTQNISPLAIARLSITPEGDLIGYKQLNNGVICRIKIPADAKRSNAAGRKCRAEYAIVLEGEGVSKYDSTFKYVVGNTVKLREPFCEDRWQECASGIHFFLTREEAEAYH